MDVDKRSLLEIDKLIDQLAVHVKRSQSETLSEYCSVYRSLPSDDERIK